MTAAHICAADAAPDTHHNERANASPSIKVTATGTWTFDVPCCGTAGGNNALCTERALARSNSFLPCAIKAPTEKADPSFSDLSAQCFLRPNRHACVRHKEATRHSTHLHSSSYKTPSSGLIKTPFGAPIIGSEGADSMISCTWCLCCCAEMKDS